MTLLLVLALAGGLTSANPPPDVSGWTQVIQRELEFRVDDYRPCFVGTVTEYRNPENANEYVRVFRRHVALVSQRPRELSDSGRQGTVWNRAQSDLSHHESSLREALKRAQEAADPFGYIRWRVTKDERTGQDILAAPLESWLLSQAGDWSYAFNEEISTSPYSEPLRADTRKNVIVGVKFWLGGVFHILRVQEKDLLAPKVTKEDTEKKEAGK